MALNQAAIEQQIGQLIDSTTDIALEQAKLEFKRQLAQIIVTAIQSATVNAGIPVTTSGGAGVTTGPGSLS